MTDSPTAIPRWWLLVCRWAWAMKQLKHTMGFRALQRG